MASNSNPLHPVPSEEEEEDSGQEDDDGEEEGSDDEEDENYIPLPDSLDESELQDFLGFAPTVSEVVSHAVRLVSRPPRGSSVSRQGARSAGGPRGRPRGRRRGTRSRAARVGDELVDDGAGEGVSNVVHFEVAATGTDSPEQRQTGADSPEQRHTAEGDGGRSAEVIENIRTGLGDGEGQATGSSGKSIEVDADPQSLPGCPICLEPWTSEGVHRVCCIPCGHVYGRSCLERWIQHCRSNSVKCPHCKTKFKEKQIINLYAPRIAAANDDLEKEVRHLRQENESLSSEKNHLLEEIHKYKRQILDLKNSERKKQACINDVLSRGTLRVFPEHAASSQCGDHGGRASCSFVLQMECKLDEARAMDIDTFNGILIVARTPTGIGAGQVISKVSLMGPGEMHDFFLPPSLGNIKDVSVAPFGIQGPGRLALLASLGKKLSILSMESNNIVLHYDLPAASWSCAWDVNNPGFIYAGLQSGALMVFDIRQTSRPLQLNVGLSFNPIHSVRSFVKHQDGSTVVTASSIGPCLWDDNPTSRRPVMVPDMEGHGICISLATCGDSSDNMVASFRPKAGTSGDDMGTMLSQPSTPSTIAGGKLGSHVLLSRTEDNSLKKCRSATGNVSGVRLSRSAIVHQNYNNPLFVHGDELLHGLSVWHIPSFQVVRRLKPHHDPILDVKYGFMNGLDAGVLSTISKSKLQVFSCSF